MTPTFVIPAFYGLAFASTALIVFLQTHEIVSGSFATLAMYMPAIVAIAFQKFLLKDKIVSGLKLHFRPHVIWLAPVSIAAGFVVLTSLISLWLRPDYFRTFTAIAQDKTIAQFSNNPITGLIFIFAVNLLVAPLLTRAIHSLQYSSKSDTKRRWEKTHDLSTKRHKKRFEVKPLRHF